MNGKSLLAVLAAGIANFLLGWLIYGILLKDFYASNTIVYPGLMKDMPDLLLIFIANLMSGLLIAVIYYRWTSIRTLGQGLIAGLIIGLVMGLMFDLYMVAMMNLYSTKVIIVDVLLDGIFTGITGGIVGYILGYGNNKTAAIPSQG